MSERKPGWYWVKDGEGWKCAEWRESAWHVGWAKYATSDFPFDDIGPRIPTPDEPWVTVPVDPTDDMIDAAMYRAGESEVPRGSESWRAMGQVIKFAHEAAPSPDEA